MYYPYLRAKQYELKALREFSEHYRNQNDIVPIIEPVKKETKSLDAAVKDLITNGCRFALILNPESGDYEHLTVSFEFWKEHENLKAFGEAWIPAFIYDKRRVDDILNMISVNNLNNVMLVFRSCIDIDDEKAWHLVEHDKVSYVVNDFGTSLSRQIRKKLIDTKREIIRLTNCFKTRAKNADYAQNVDEFFTDEPFYYETDSLSGYSDYTVLPSDYIGGGMQPYALAIHFTYRRNDDSIYVHHFVSDSNRTSENVRGKFKEAADKVVTFYESKTKTQAVKDLIEKTGRPDGYPGLGYLKKLSILNHLELIKSL